MFSFHWMVLFFHISLAVNIVTLRKPGTISEKKSRTQNSEQYKKNRRKIMRQYLNPFRIVVVNYSYVTISEHCWVLNSK